MLLFQILILVLFLSGEWKWNAAYINVNTIVMCCFMVNFIHCIVGTSCSAFTVISIYRQVKHQPKQDMMLTKEKLRGSVTIFLMNIPHIITASCIFRSLVDSTISWFDISFIFCPILTATLNASFIVLRSQNIRYLMRGYFEKIAVFLTPPKCYALKVNDRRSKSTSSRSVVYKNVLHVTAV